MKQTITAVAGAALMAAASLTMVGTPASASPAGVVSPAATAPAAAVIGTTADAAAGSCWEIKQARPTAADGSYWLLTPAMTAPEQFYCDMTTDGGGWVLVGKGRNGWTTGYDGKGAAGSLLTPESDPMAANTVQLPSATVDALLNHGRVDLLTDGVRVRRAKTTTGSQWQEARIRFASHARWNWSFGATYALASSSFDGTSYSGGAFTSFGSGTSYNKIKTSTESAMGWYQGFAYGSSVTGSSNTSTYLFSATNGAGQALPTSYVYLRPRVASTDAGFTTIPDAGTAAAAQPALPESRALKPVWGVAGLAGASAREGNVEVQAFTQSGNRMYVGGNFRYVQRDEDGTDRVEQSFLAAFDVTTGEWVSSFRPDFNEQVHALATLPNGQVVAGGDFTIANGAVARSLVALDPVTGATSTGWQAQVADNTTSGALSVRALAVSGDRVFVGGSFTHISGGGNATNIYQRNIGRLSASTGAPVRPWNADLNGTVAALDVADDGGRVYAAGWFTKAGATVANRAVALSTSDGAAVATPAWSPTWSHTTNYQQAVVEHDGKVWVAGSQHSLFEYDTTTFGRLNGTIFKNGGDGQAAAYADGVVYAGCHCFNFGYSDAYSWTSGTLPSGWSEADAISGFGAWDAASGKRLPAFVPSIKGRAGSGIWAIDADSTGVVWAGGDIARVAAVGGTTWSGGFARFAPRDATAPDRPGDLRLTDQDDTTVTLAWDGVAGSGVGYQVLRDDRPIATTSSRSITLPSGGDNRYFVRAVDAAGNVSASTPVLRVTPPAAGSQVVVEEGSTWQWTYPTTAPAADWASTGFDDGSWSTGDAVLGFGSTVPLATTIDSYPTTSERPVAAYFRRELEIADASSVSELTLRTVADDGVVVYVNGVEVGRSNMPEGTVTHRTYAASARNTTVADDDPFVIEVPTSVLVSGTNVIAVETHLNYRATKDVSFDLRATLLEN